MLAQKQPYIQRVRNSSLVERSCAENVTGLKHDTEAQGCINTEVEEHCHRDEAVLIKSGGFVRRENAGMSSEMKVRILQAEYLRFPG